MPVILLLEIALTSRLDLLHNYVKNQGMNLVLSVFICVA